MSHLPFKDFLDFLLPFGFQLFGFYEQSREFTKPYLRRTNPVFISKPLIEANDLN